MHKLQARLKVNKPECCRIRLTIRTPLIIFAWIRKCIWASLCLTALNKRLETGRGWEQGELMFCWSSAPQDITTISVWAVKVHSAQVSQGSEHWGVSEPELCFTVTITLPQDVLEGGGKKTPRFYLSKAEEPKCAYQMFVLMDLRSGLWAFASCPLVVEALCNPRQMRSDIAGWQETVECT